MFYIIQSLYNNLGNLCITKQFISVQIYIVKEQCQTLKTELLFIKTIYLIYRMFTNSKVLSQ